MANPCHSIGFCPICGDGLCGIRIFTRPQGIPYGLVVCDECEATWMEPDLSLKPYFPDSDDARSPLDGQPLWGSSSHWADLRECAQIGWLGAVDPVLHCHGKAPFDDDPTSVSHKAEPGGGDEQDGGDAGSINPQFVRSKSPDDEASS